MGKHFDLQAGFSWLYLEFLAAFLALAPLLPGRAEKEDLADGLAHGTHPGRGILWAAADDLLGFSSRHQTDSSDRTI